MIGTAVQKAIYDALMAAPAVAGGNNFDSVPSSDPFPRTTIGEEQVLEDGNSCDDGWEVLTDTHVWSRKPGFGEVKTLAALVRQRINAITSVTGYTLISVEVEDTRFLRDPDGITSHGIISARWLIGPA